MAGENGNELAGTETPGGTAVAEPAPQPAPQPSAPAPAGGDDLVPGKTYTSEQVQQIVQSRLKGWQEFGKPEELRQRLTRSQQLEQHFERVRAQFARPGDLPGADPSNQPPQFSEDDRKVIQYFEKLFPGLGKYKEQLGHMEQSMRAFDEYRYGEIADKNSTFMRGIAEKEGYKPEHMENLERYVANSILGTPEDFKRYLATGDREIVKKHFVAVNDWIKGFRQPDQAAPPPAPVPGAVKAAGGARTAALPPRMPQGGVPAPTSKTGKLNDSERVSAAFDRLTKGA